MRSTSELDSTSPYPPSSPSVESELENADHTWSHTMISSLRSSIANIPESELRSLIVRLANKDLHFQRAIREELTCSLPLDSSASVSPTTPTHKRHKARRNRIPRHNKEITISRKSSWSDDNLKTPRRATKPKICFHPGTLEEDVYEFLSCTSDKGTCNAFRTVTIWSCCDDDEFSPGCVYLPAPNTGGQESGEEAVVNHSNLKGVYPNTFEPSDSNESDSDVFPDSDSDRQYGADFLAPRSRSRSKPAVPLSLHSEHSQTDIV
ncbi:hypothetical protein CPC08DRAFT_648885 [Agrocybe pediades]|nr:hypothetical protein CPC08DRAFT_648885 [Agrocybe pediades]